MKMKSIFGICLFYIVAIVCRYSTNQTNILAQIDSEFLKITLQALGPTIGAFLAVAIFKLKFSMSLKGHYQKFLTSLVLFWLMPIVLISFKAYFTKNVFPFTTVLSILVYALLEEIGWRGFMQEQLKPLPKLWSILIIALLWFIWHLNFELSISNFVFLIILILGTWGIGKVANKTQSLLAASAFHSINNFYSEWSFVNISIICVLLFFWLYSVIYSEKVNAIFLNNNNKR